MNPTALGAPATPLHRAIGASVLVHVCLLGFIVWSGSRAPTFQPSTSIPVQLVRLGKKRDPSWLPRKTRPASKKADAVSLATEKNKTKSDPLSGKAKALLEGPGGGDRIEESLSRVLEELEGSPDGDPEGTVTDGEVARGYHAKISAALNRAYELPQTIPASLRPFLKARVLLFISENGAILRHEILDAHPDQSFQSSLTAMLSGLKLPPPPGELAASLRNQGVEVVFRP